MTQPKKVCKGAKNGASKLTTKQVLDIRRDYASGSTQAELAARYGTVQGNISMIVTRRTWRHVP